MRINHNASAVNAYRSNMETMKRVEKSTEKLTSGLRVNRAGDDSAGLAISEKMRGQISGLAKSERNTQDAISLIQTAEGSLNETHTILQRMRELAVQSANDTNTNSDRRQLQLEVNRLRQEVDRIADNTEFNQKRLLTGEFEKNGLTFQVGANEGQIVTFKLKDMGAEALGIAGIEKVSTSTEFEVKKMKTIKQNDDTLLDLDAGVGGKEHNLKVDKDYKVKTSSRKIAGSKDRLDLKAITKDKQYQASVDKNADTSYSEKKRRKSRGVEESAEVIRRKRFSKTAGVNISTGKTAEKAITTVEKAIEKVSDERSRYGAMQNRMEHTMKNLSVFRENLMSSESRIRDANMAMEIVSNSKDRIISQSGNSMLAQANTEPQKVLQLLG